jgi:NAD+ kinase
MLQRRVRARHPARRGGGGSYFGGWRLAFPVRRCALVGRFADPRITDCLGTLVPHLRSRGVEVLVSENDDLAGEATDVTRVPEHQIGERADLVIAVGGDGTLLYAARLVAGRAVPLIGVNRGRLGFLTDVMPQDMLPSVDAALAGELAEDQRPLLQARLHGARGQLAEALALNDVVMQKHDTGRTLDFETRIDGHYVNTHDGDGIIVASPTGSTAYALSCSGPIIEPHLPALVIVPICAHTLSDRPIVVAASSVIEITLLERLDTRANVTCDGMILGPLLPGDHLEITTAAERVTLLHPPGHDYYKLLRSKLHWGRGSFERS